jgi:hypothetical protein
MNYFLLDPSCPLEISQNLFVIPRKPDAGLTATDRKFENLPSNSVEGDEKTTTFRTGTQRTDSEATERARTVDTVLGAEKVRKASGKSEDGFSRMHLYCMLGCGPN